MYCIVLIFPFFLAHKPKELCLYTYGEKKCCAVYCKLITSEIDVLLASMLELMCTKKNFLALPKKSHTKHFFRCCQFACIFLVVVAEMAKFVTFPFVSSSEFLSEFKGRAAPLWRPRDQMVSAQEPVHLADARKLLSDEPWPRSATLPFHIYFLKTFASLVLVQRKKEEKRDPNTIRGQHEELGVGILLEMKKIGCKHHLVFGGRASASVL